MEIRLANKNDIEKLNELFKAVINDLNNVKKIDMLWGEIYPFCEFEKDISNKEMYIMEENNEIIGSFVLSEFDDPDYHNIEWTSKNMRWFYLNRLAIHPSVQGKGFAKKAMEFIGEYAVGNNYDCIRLTVYNQNIYAIGLYEKLGFTKISNGYWQLKDKVFVGYEKYV